MRYILFIAAFFISSLAYGQGTWNKASTNNAWNRTKADSVAIVPRDTSATNNAILPSTGLPVGDYGRIAAKHGFFYFHDSTRNRKIAFSDEVTDTLYERRSELGYVNVKWFGAVGDGINDDAAAINNAISAAESMNVRAILFPRGEYLVGSTINVPEYLQLVGVNKSWSILKTTSDASIFAFSGRNTVRDLGFYGDGKGATYDAGKTSQHAIYSATSSYNVIESCDFNNLGGAAVFIGNSGRYNQVRNNNFVSNNIGIYIGQSEYNQINNCSVVDGNTAIKINLGGNNSIVGGNYSYNLTGLRIIGSTGFNDGHSVCVGATINHNMDYSVFIDNVTLGYVFAGCMMYYGSLYIKEGKYVQFTACDIDVTGGSIFVEGGLGHRFTDCRFMGSFAFQPNYNGSPSQAFIRNPYFQTSNSNWYFLYNIVGGYSENYVKGDSAIAPSSTWKMAWDSLRWNSISGHLYYQQDTFYRSATREFTAFAFGGDEIKINGQVYLETAASPDAFRIELVTNTGSIPDDHVYRLPYSREGIGGGNFAYRFSISKTIQLEAGDSFFIRIINNDPSNGIIVKQSGDTFITVHGL
jgi:parallel beta-helix repeat protein